MSIHPTEFRPWPRPIGANFQADDLNGRANDSVRMIWRYDEFQELHQLDTVLEDHSINPEGDLPDSNVESSSSDEINPLHDGKAPEVNTSIRDFPSPRGDSTAAVNGSASTGSQNNSSSPTLSQTTERAVRLARVCRDIAHTMCESFRDSKPWLKLIDPTSAFWLVYIIPAAASCDTLKDLFSALLDSLLQPAHVRHQCATDNLCVHNAWHVYHARKLARLTENLERFLEDFSPPQWQIPRTFTLSELASVLAQYVARFHACSLDITRSWLKLEHSVIMAALSVSETRIVPLAVTTLDAATATACAAADARDAAEAELNALQHNQDVLKLREAEIKRELRLDERCRRNDRA
ncbi:hypothetical protein B0H12DRAFT_1234671 [Mycena haematopus]|nr:hypothetical protein B0H12DRAFT_1234671 [Mycena haematopus]